MTLNSPNFDAFYVVAQEAHFTRAAERLHITQSALSQRIKNLEEELGTTLFLRKKTGVTLTEQGRWLLRLYQTRQSLDLDFLEPLLRENSTELAGAVRIGGFSSVMRSKILPALSTLAQKNPRLQLKMVTKELHELRTSLDSGEIDYLISYEKFDDELFVSEKLGDEVDVLAQKKGAKIPPYILDHDEHDQVSLQFLGHKVMKTQRRHFLEDVYGLIEGIRLGLGRAVVPLHLIEDLRDVEVVSEFKQKANPVYLNYFRRPYYSRLHTELLSALHQSWK